MLKCAPNPFDERVVGSIPHHGMGQATPVPDVVNVEPGVLNPDLQHPSAVESTLE